MGCLVVHHNLVTSALKCYIPYQIKLSLKKRREININANVFNKSNELAFLSLVPCAQALA